MKIPVIHVSILLSSVFTDYIINFVVLDGCSHNLVNYFLIEAIRNPAGFTAIKCDSYKNYLEGVCKNGDKVNLGGDLTNLEGVFYFETNSEPPYSKG